MDLGQTSNYLTHSSESLVALDFTFSIFLPAKVGTQFFFVCPSQVWNFLRCVSPQIANPQICKD